MFRASNDQKRPKYAGSCPGEHSMSILLNGVYLCLGSNSVLLFCGSFKKIEIVGCNDLEFLLCSRRVAHWNYALIFLIWELAQLTNM